MASRGRQRTSFDKLQRERARQERQAAKRARRQGGEMDGPAVQRFGTPEDAGAEVPEPAPAPESGPQPL